MHAIIILSLLLAPLTAFAASIPFSHLAILPIKDPVKPSPCEGISPPPTAEETKARFNKFADAFIVRKDITCTFTFISQGYINHNPAAENGFDSAWNLLSPIWKNQTITPLRTTFNGTQGWLNYRTESFGEVVDRFRWEDGCIAEHWDQGEVYPV